jgi:hypothetical protein
MKMTLPISFHLEIPAPPFQKFFTLKGSEGLFLKSLEMEMRLKVWFPLKPPLDVHFSLVEMPNVVYPVKVSYGIIPLPDPMSVSGLKTNLKTWIQVRFSLPLPSASPSSLRLPPSLSLSPP